VGPSAVTDAYALNRRGTAWSRLLLRGVHGEISVGSARSNPPFILSRLAVFSSSCSPSTLVLLPTIALPSHLARLLRSR
jgi:hypothetical protein